MSRTRRKTAALALVPVLGMSFALATLLTSSPASGATRGSGAGGPQARHHEPLPSWQLKPVDSTEQFRGLDAVSRDVAWVGGSNGSIFRTVDGGDTWANVSPPDATGLLFRDVEAFGRNRAVVLAIGEGDASRVYRTDDGGQTWTQTFTNPDPAAFYDCMAFSTGRHGLASATPPTASSASSRPRWRSSWKVRSPPACRITPGEFAFAASGTCLTTSEPRHAWFATAGTRGPGLPLPRPWPDLDGGRDPGRQQPRRRASSRCRSATAARLRDRRRLLGGREAGPAVDASRSPATGAAPGALVPADDAPAFYRSGSAFVQLPARHHSSSWLHEHPSRARSHASRIALAVGPTGSDISFDSGNTWTAFDPASGGFDSVECAGDGSCWASQKNGKVARVTFAQPRLTRQH